MAKLPAGWNPETYRLIVAGAKAYGLDPAAVISVALGEGGVRWGSVGDNNTSFGPFQLHVGGALPKGKDAAWANSREGIYYALRQMANVGAAGLAGDRAINTIIREFERPANPDASVSNATNRYDDLSWLHGVNVPNAPAATPIPATKSSQARATLLNYMATMQPGLLPSQALGSFLQRQREAQTTMSDALTLSSAGEQPPGDTTSFSLPNGMVSPLAGKLPKGSEFWTSDAEGAGGPKGRYHAALDWFGNAGQTVYSPWGGKIVEITPSRGNKGQVFGGVVKVQAPNGMVFVSRHVDPYKLQVGQTIAAGAPLAGITDWQGGSDHAHVEIWKSLRGGYKYTNMLDPLEVFRSARR